MNSRRIIGMLFVLVGIAGIFYANFQQDRINQKSGEAEQKISSGKSLFQGNPVVEKFDDSMASSARGKVATEVAKYEQIVNGIKIGSIFLIVIGAGMLLFCTDKKSRKK